MFNRDDIIARARTLAEDFAKLKTPQFLKAFINDTGIARELKRLEKSDIDDSRYIDLVVNEYQVPFGQAMALAYVMGAIDFAEKVPSSSYRQKQKPPEGETEA